VRRFNLSFRLVLITAVALIPTTSVLVYDLLSLRMSREREVHADASRIAELVGLEMNQIVGGAENLLRAVVFAPVVRRADAAGCEEYVTRIGEVLPQFVAVAVIDAGGVIRCTPNAAATGTFVGDRSYFTEVIETGQLVVGTYTEGRVTNRPSLPIAIPLPGGGAWSGGIAVAGLDLDWLGARLKDRNFTRGGALTIADRNGRILAREPFPEDFVGTLIPDAFQHLVTADAPGTLEVTSKDGTRRVIGYRPVGTSPAGLYVSAGLSTEAAYGALNRATLRGLLIAAISIGAAFLLARSTSEVVINRPFQRLLNTIAEWRGGRVGARTGMTARDGEFGAVGKAIDDFMDELIAARASRRRSEQQRELLLGELDHRVKNLIATVQAVARQTFPNAERTDAVDVFMNRLATMSNAHALLMQDDWQEVALKRVVETTIAPFVDPERPQFSVAGPDFVVNSKAVLPLGMALHELCTNAVKYGALQTDAGRVAVNWDVTRDRPSGAALRLTWRESGGPPVAPPQRKGFGSRMIEQVLAHQIGGEVSLAYPAEGLVCVVTALVEVIGPKRDEAA